MSYCTSGIQSHRTSIVHCQIRGLSVRYIHILNIGCPQLFAVPKLRLGETLLLRDALLVMRTADGMEQQEGVFLATTGTAISVLRNHVHCVGLFARRIV